MSSQRASPAKSIMQIRFIDLYLQDRLLRSGRRKAVILSFTPDKGPAFRIPYSMHVGDKDRMIARIYNFTDGAVEQRTRVIQDGDLSPAHLP